MLKGAILMYKDYLEIIGDVMDEVAEWLDYEADNPWAE